MRQPTDLYDLGQTDHDLSDVLNNNTCDKRGDGSNSTFDTLFSWFAVWQVWDSDKLHTCVCDTGYHGFDCALRKCPTGDDPLTTGQVNEIQLVVCEVRAARRFPFVVVFPPVLGRFAVVIPS